MRPTPTYMYVCIYPRVYLMPLSVSLSLSLSLRLRDLSAEDKLEHQRVKKDFERNATELNQIKEQKDKLAQELQVGVTCSRA